MCSSYLHGFIYNLHLYLYRPLYFEVYDLISCKIFLKYSRLSDFCI